MVCLTWAEDCLPTYKCSNPCTFNSWFPSSLGILKGFPSCQGINTRFPSIKGIVQIIYRGPIPFRPGNQCQIPKILGNHLRVPCRLGNQYSVPVNKRNHKAISCADSLPVRESWSYSRNRRESWKNRFRFPSMTGIGGQFRDRKGTGGIQERSSFPIYSLTNMQTIEVSSIKSCHVYAFSCDSISISGTVGLSVG